MASLLTPLNWLLPLLYLALLIDYGVTFFLRTKAHARNPWLLPVIGVHAVFFILRAVYLGYPPVASSFEVLSVLALSTAAVHCVVEMASHDRRTGMFVFLLVFVFQYTSSVFFAETIAPAAAEGLRAQSGWGRLHVLPAVMSYTAFTVSAVYGLLHLTARRGLKEHRLGMLFDRLPSLDLLGRMSWYSLLVGFAFMTIVVCTGPFLMRAGGAEGGTSVWDLKVSTKIFIGSTAWLVYMVAILGRLLGKWSSARICRIAIGGFAVVMALLVVSTLLS
jgi:ABC-type uncharacterized transport system permease subunit